MARAPDHVGKVYALESVTKWCPPEHLRPSMPECLPRVDMSRSKESVERPTVFWAHHATPKLPASRWHNVLEKQIRAQDPPLCTFVTVFGRMLHTDSAGAIPQWRPSDGTESGDGSAGPA